MASDAVVNLVVNADGADTRITAQMRSIVNDAERRAPEINLRVDVDTSTLDRRLQREFGILGTRLNSSLGAVNDSIQAGFRDMTDQLSGDLRQLSQRLNAVNNNIVSVNSSVNRLGDNDGIRRVADDADDADRNTRHLSDTFRGMGRHLGSLAGIASRLTLISSAAAGAVPVVASIATAVESIVPAAAAGVTAFVGLKAATLTLKVGLSGVEDAISAVFDPNAKPEALEKALENLSKNAQSFVKELQKLKPALSDLRLDVQDRLFRNLDKQLAATAKASLPALRHAALGFADSLNIMAARTGATAQRLAENGTLGKALESGRSAFEKLERVPSQVLDAILKLAVAGGPLLNRLTGGITDLADSLSKRLDKAAATGGLQKAVDNAGKALAQLGRIASNVFEGLGNIFEVANSSGAGLFGTLEKLSAAFADATASTEFQQTLGLLVNLSQTLVTTALPLLQTAFGALMLVVQELAPVFDLIIGRLADELQPLFVALSPVIQQVAALFGDILLAILPLVENGLEILIAVMPSLNELFIALRDLVQELTPLILYLAEGLGVILPPLIDILIKSLIGWTEILTLVVMGIRQLIEWIAQFVAAIIEDMQPTIQVISALLAGDFKGALNLAGQAIVDFVVTTIVNFGRMGASVARIVYDMISNLVSGFRSGLNGVVNYVRGFVPTIVGYIYSLRNQILSTVNSLASGLYQAGANMIRSLADGMLSQLGDAVSAANSIVGAIADFFPHSPAKRGPFSGQGYPLYSGQSVIDSFAAGILSRRSALENALSSTLGASLATSGLSADVSATGSLTAPGSAVTAAARSASSDTVTPSVTVYLGNELVRNFVTTIVGENNAQRDRLAAQGARG